MGQCVSKTFSTQLWTRKNHILPRKIHFKYHRLRYSSAFASRLNADSPTTFRFLKWETALGRQSNRLKWLFFSLFKETSHAGRWNAEKMPKTVKKNNIQISRFRLYLVEFVNHNGNEKQVHNFENERRQSHSPKKTTKKWNKIQTPSRLPCAGSHHSRVRVSPICCHCRRVAVELQTVVILQNRNSKYFIRSWIPCFHNHFGCCFRFDEKNNNKIPIWWRRPVCRKYE